MRVSREDPRKFTISEDAIKSVVTGKSGSKSKEDGLGDIRETARNFDLRLQQFIDDMLFLYQLDEYDEWECLWENISKANNLDHIQNWDIWFSPYVLNSHPPSALADDIEYPKDSVQFGANLAQIPRIISETNVDVPYDHLLWGFLIGLVSDDPSDRESEVNKIRDILEQLDNQIPPRMAGGKEQYLSHDETGELITDVKALHNLGFRPTESLIDKIWHEIYIGDIDLPEEPKLNTHVQTRVFRPILDHLLEETKLDVVRGLIEELENDSQVLSEPDWNNIIPINIIMAIGKENQSVDTDDIVPYIDGTKSGAKKILNDLSGNGEETTGENWDNPSIINEISTDQWSFTDYGELLYLFNIGEITIDVLHNYGVNTREYDGDHRELITSVIDSLYSDTGAIGDASC